MTRDEAFQLLRLKEGSSEDQIRTRFKELALEVHPDKGGDPLVMAQLLTARELVLGHVASLALVPMDEVRELVASELSALAVRYESQDRRERSFSRIKRYKTSYLRKWCRF